jgi:hypothetical protein
MGWFIKCDRISFIVKNIFQAPLEGWTISLLNRETVPLSAEVLKPHKFKQKLIFYSKLALIRNERPPRYRFFPRETNKILGEVLHPFLHLYGEIEKV